MTGPREQFALTAAELVEHDAKVALVYAEISGQYLGDVRTRHPHRVVNVGIREQLLVSAGAGMALAGLRPIVHTFGSFLVERAFEQVKLDFAHQGVGGVLVGSGGSFDVSSGGRTHQSPGDVALVDTLGVPIHAPSTPSEVDASLRTAVDAGGLHYVRVVEQVNGMSFGPGAHVVRRGTGPVVVALGPVLDAALAATEGLDATVLYTSTVRPFDSRLLRSVLARPEVVLVEPWLAGTSAHVVADALHDVPHRLLALGVRRGELRRYGTPADHLTAHGLDAAGLRTSITRFVDGTPPRAS
ncbi:MAG: transketolase family protein [Phycicoccus sp.]